MEGQTRHLTPSSRSVSAGCSLFPTLSSDLYQADEGGRGAKRKNSCVLTSSLWLLFQISHLQARKHGQNGDMCIRCVIFALLPVGIHVHVPDPDPGGLDRCHGPDPGGCGSHVGPSCSHLLHPLPSVRYFGEELSLSLQQ